MKEHIATQKILLYLADKLDEQDAMAIDRHMDQCQACARRMNIFHYIQDHFDSLWHSIAAWMGENSALSEYFLCDECPGQGSEYLNRRLRNWYNNFLSSIHVAVSLVVKEQGCKVSDGLAWLFPDGPCAIQPRMEYASAPLQVLGEGGDEPVRVTVKGQTNVRMTIDPQINRISVRLAISEKPFLPLTLLVPRHDGKIRLSRFRHPEGTDYLLADFENVTQGEYTLLIGRRVFHDGHETSDQVESSGWPGSPPSVLH